MNGRGVLPWYTGEGRDEYVFKISTRMYSSRMRTAHSLIVSLYLVVTQACLPSPCMSPFTTHAPLATHPPLQPHMPPGNHACPPATTHAPLATTHAPRQPCTPGNHIPQQQLRMPPLWTESHTPVKTQPCPNFVAGGKYLKCSKI